MSVLYDRIAAGYGALRRTEPRWMARIDVALGSARTVVNVGAGTGSYEPLGRSVVAVEPSMMMIAQRASDAAPVLRAVAERLPFRAATFDAALAVLSIHHWSDPARGLAELRRVARTIVVLTSDPGAIGAFWLNDYFPSIARFDAAKMMPLPAIAEVMGGARIETLPVPHHCVDGFCGAYWRRPERYFDPGVRAAISGFAVIPEDEVRSGLDALRRDLDSGEWRARNGHILEETELDLGYRLLVSV